MDKDELGAVRHAMTAKELNDLYKSLENFIADCTRSEVDANRDALNKVQTMIHQRMRLKQNSNNRRGKPRHKQLERCILRNWNC